MWRTSWFFFLILTILLSAPPIVHGGDIDDVRTIFENDIRLLNARNNDAFSVNAHDSVVLYGILSPFATKGKADLQQLVAHYLTDNTRVNFITVNPEVFVAGDSAVAWGHYTISENPKIGPRVSIHGRYTLTYSKIGGRWFLAAMHLSPLQSYQ
jgi:ketosteroid isomerase-like protein